ncbi:MAG: hypothetical protein HUU11_19000 [Anaerolineales bacterium]|nr:hypothetical protein [Anaerolineales bacterium]
MGEVKLFGKRKFGTFKFGATTLKNPRYGLEVDWDSDGLFDGTNEGANLNGLTIERGRKYTVSAEGDAFQAEDTGSFSAVLLDLDRRYDPFNASSPLYGMLTGGKQFRVTVRTMSDEVYPLMAGVLDEPVSYMERRAHHARLQGEDGWGFLRDQMNEVTIALQENIYVDEAMRLVLEKAGWKRPWGYELDPGVDLRNYFWVDARSAAAVIHEAAQNELGTVSMNARGNLRFRSRNSQEAEVLQLTDTDCLSVQKMSPKEVVRNLLKVASAPRSEEATQTVFETVQRIQVDPGETINDVWVDFTYNSESAPVKDPITPVSGTDYDAYANPDGSGTNLTANISMSMTPFSTRAQLSLTNSGGTTAHVYFRVRGKPLSKTNTVSFQTRDEASIRQFGARPFTLNIDQNVNVAREYRDLLEIFFVNAKNYLTVDLMPNPDVQFAADLGDVIRANLTNHGIDRSFRVIGIKHESHDRAGIVMRTKWWLEPYTRLFSGVQVPMQVPFQIGAA